MRVAFAFVLVLVITLSLSVSVSACALLRPRPVRLPPSCAAYPLDGPWRTWRGAAFELAHEDVYTPSWAPPETWSIERRSAAREQGVVEYALSDGQDVRWRCQFRQADRAASIEYDVRLMRGEHPEGPAPQIEGFQIDTWCGPNSDVVREFAEDAPSLWRSTSDGRGTKFRVRDESDNPAYSFIQVLTRSGRCYTSVDLIYEDEAARDAEAVARLIEDVLSDA